jgi:hypothetical protein
MTAQPCAQIHVKHDAFRRTAGLNLVDPRGGHNDGGARARPDKLKSAHLKVIAVCHIHAVIQAHHNLGLSFG